MLISKSELMVHASNPTTWEMEADGSGIQTLGYIVDHISKTIRKLLISGYKTSVFILKDRDKHIYRSQLQSCYPNMVSCSCFEIYLPIFLLFMRTSVIEKFKCVISLSSQIPFLLNIWHFQCHYSFFNSFIEIWLTSKTNAYI